MPGNSSDRKGPDAGGATMFAVFRREDYLKVPQVDLPPNQRIIQSVS